MDSEKGNRVFARGHNVPPPPPFGFWSPKKPGLDGENDQPQYALAWNPGLIGTGVDVCDSRKEVEHMGSDKGQSSRTQYAYDTL